MLRNPKRRRQCSTAFDRCVGINVWRTSARQHRTNESAVLRKAYGTIWWVGGPVCSTVQYSTRRTVHYYRWVGGPVCTFVQTDPGSYRHNAATNMNSSGAVARAAESADQTIATLLCTLPGSSPKLWPSEGDAVIRRAHISRNRKQRAAGYRTKRSLMRCPPPLPTLRGDTVVDCFISPLDRGGASPPPSKGETHAAIHRQ